MRLMWLVIGVLITIGLFLFYPGLFKTLVNGVQWLIHEIQLLVGV